jgi:hypothetical protein
MNYLIAGLAAVGMAIVSHETTAGGDLKSDPLAGKTLESARAARATWENFPGLSADLEVNLDGKVSRGKVTITGAGKVTFGEMDRDAESWAKPVLGSLVAHRIDSGTDRNVPCAFADKDEDHPLGRAIAVLNDKYHSSYRVRERQMIVVNRVMKTTRFSIIVLENQTNKEGKFLPANFIVQYWDTKTGNLQKSEATTQSWLRIGRFDLPATVRVVTAGKELSAKSLTLSNHNLLTGSGRR